MEVDRTIEIERWVDQLRLELPVTRIIEVVEERMLKSDDGDKYQFTLALKNLLIEARREQEADELIAGIISRMPDDVRFPIARATLHLYYLNQPSKALEYIDDAIQRACRTGHFVREALGTKARILLQLGRFDDLAVTLEEIMSHKIEWGSPDVGPERDFVDRAPHGAIPDDVLARYDKFCLSHSGK